MNPLTMSPNKYMILLAILLSCLWQIQAQPNMTVSGNLLSLDLYPETNAFTLRSARSFTAKPQITVRWESILEKVRPFAVTTPGYIYIPTAPVIRTVHMNSSSIERTFSSSNVTWSAQNPTVPRFDFGYNFPDGAKVKFPMFIFKNADRVHFPLGYNLSLPIDKDAIKFSLSVQDWKHSGNASEAELWIGFRIAIELDTPVTFALDLIGTHTLRPPVCTNGSSPEFGAGPVNTVRLDFENLAGTYLKVSIPDLSLVDNTTFDCLLSVNSIGRDPSVIQQFFASGRTQLKFDLFFKASRSVEYDPDLTLVFGANYDAQPPTSTSSGSGTPSSTSGADPLQNSVNGSANIGMIAGIVCGCVVAFAILFVIVAVRYKPLRTRLSVMQWKTSAASRIQSVEARSQESSSNNQRASWSTGKVSASARNSIMSE